MASRTHAARHAPSEDASVYEEHRDRSRDRERERDRESEHSAEHYAEEDQEEEEEEVDLQSLSLSHTHTNPNSPTRLVVTHEGTLDRSLLPRVDGYMHKKGGAVNARGGFRNWKRRWFSLESVQSLHSGVEGFELRYYDRPGGVLKGAVHLSDVDVHVETKSAHNKRIKNEFQLVLQSGGELQLAVEDPEEREEWLETLRTVIAYLHKVSSRSATTNAMLLDGYDPLAEDDAQSFRIGEEIAQNCQAFGPGLFGSEAGVAAQFVLQIHDLLGQPVRRGGMPITAFIEDLPLREKRFYVAVSEGEDGLYYAHYTLGVAGNYSLSLLLNDEHHVFGSPFEIEIFPTSTSAKHCTVHGEALDRVIIAQRSELVITARDSLENAKKRGGDPFEVSVLGSARLVELRDTGEGTYVCVLEGLPPTQRPHTTQSYNAHTQPTHTAHGSLLVNVTLYGRAVRGSPFKPALVDAASLSLAQSLSQSLSPTPSVRERDRESESVRETAKRDRAKENERERERDVPLTAADLSLSLSLPTHPHNTTTQPHTHTQSAASQEPPMSRLERSRQRALLARSLAESRAHNATTQPTQSTQSTQSAATQPTNTTNIQYTSTQPPATHNAITQPSHTPTHTPRVSLTEKPPTQSTQVEQPPVAATPPLHNPLTQQQQVSRPPLTQPRHMHTQAHTLSQTQTLTQSDASLHWLSGAHGAAVQRSGSKLTALAQRNAALLAAKKNGVPVTAASIVDTSSTQTREAFLAETAAQLRSGLGRISAALSGGVAQSGPAESLAWDQTNKALGNETLITRLLTHIDTLTAVFNVFAERVETLSLVRILTTHPHGGLFRCLELYNVIPSSLSRVEVKTLFTLLTNAQRAQRTPASLAGNGTALDMSFFLKALVLFSVFACNKSVPGSGAAPGAVEQQLVRWGFMDAGRLIATRRALGL